ncbi:hypothetical protein MHUMG1_06369 [Metarhizium humberi]|uniref:Sodium/calcium exchanger membrane region domain-containing protein n=1 Tax=Metarhizium humberi TaxID=2596975 RepID=A0A9P8M927_9HYPO|nr:hypothetical protein MHUMG1_06369 [Metarhizium humberi]
MAQDVSLPYNICVFISTLFLLEFATDKFISHAAALASVINVSELLIGLVTAGGEWEELAVVVSSLGQGRSSLALGNVIGASISNILGAFSLGLLCSRNIEFDRGSRIYSLLTLVLTTLVVPVVYYSSRVVWIVCGSGLIVGFVVYFVSVGVAVVKGVLAAPEDSDSEDDDDDQDEDEDTERTALVGNPSPRPPRRSIAHHTLQLIFGIVALALSAYILSHAAANITTQLHMSDISFGVVILSIATTLPEKLISVYRRRAGQRHSDDWGAGRPLGVYADFYSDSVARGEGSQGSWACHDFGIRRIHSIGVYNRPSGRRLARYCNHDVMVSMQSLAD